MTLLGKGRTWKAQGPCTTGWEAVVGTADSVKPQTQVLPQQASETQASKDYCKAGVPASHHEAAAA